MRYIAGAVGVRHSSHPHARQPWEGWNNGQCHLLRTVESDVLAATDSSGAQRASAFMPVHIWAH